jgi:hypothetical protein
VGLLMCKFQTDRNTAFEVLRDHARSNRRKVNEVADQLLSAEETLNALHAAFNQRLKSKTSAAFFDVLLNLQLICPVLCCRLLVSRTKYLQATLCDGLV